MNINIITLGCSKNLVDSEYLLRQFHSNGFTVYHDETEIEAEVVILNTCGFILDAKQESIDNILHFAKMKKQGKIKKLIVMGCLSERYRSDLQKEIPEVDAFFGVWDHEKIVQSVGASYRQDLTNNRLITTPDHYAYLKISEGCNRKCAFCAIPVIRGKQRSKRIDDLLIEAENLVTNGVREIILIAQDLTNYGIDIHNRNGLSELLKKLAKIDGIEWIRMHYAYPTGFPNEVIEIMADNPKICNYIDIPIQHINDRILKAMNRGHNRKELENLLNDFRSKVPGVAIRTTIMVGFPGETDNEFRELYDFVKSFKFDRLGVFPYSHEEDTPASDFTDDVASEVKEERVGQIMELQQQISMEINNNKIGKTFKVLIDNEEQDYYVGRTEFDSPEVDNEVLIEKTGTFKPGEFVNVRIAGAEEFDLFGSVIE